MFGEGELSFCIVKVACMWPFNAALENWLAAPVAPGRGSGSRSGIRDLKLLTLKRTGNGLHFVFVRSVP
jgi:hypothetical protein